MEGGEAKLRPLEFTLYNHIMKTITRDQIKKIFKKIKHLRLDSDYDDVDFEKLKFYSWIDTSGNSKYFIYEFKGKIEGICFDITKMTKAPLQLGFCEICKQHRPRSGIVLISSKTRKRPKNIDYRVRGNYVCIDSTQCNLDMQDNEGIDRLFGRIIE